MPSSSRKKTTNNPLIIKDADVVAILAGNKDLLVRLLDGGTDVHAAANGDREPIIHKLARSGDTECVKIMLDRGCPIHISNYKKHTLGHSAAEKGHDRCLEMLLKRGLDPNKFASGDMPMLFYAVLASSPSCVQVLCENGADVNAIDNGGWSAGHWCFNALPNARARGQTGSMWNRLAKHGANPFLDDDRSRSLFEYGASFFVSEPHSIPTAGSDMHDRWSAYAIAALSSGRSVAAAEAFLSGRIHDYVVSVVERK